jgi:hypothetical protein
VEAEAQNPSSEIYSLSALNMIYKVKTTPVSIFRVKIVALESLKRITERILKLVSNFKEQARL